MFQQRDIITAVEIGTSKLHVLVGQIDNDSSVTVIGSGEVPAANAVVKGEIADMDRALELLISAIEEADNSCNREINNSKIIFFNVTGAGISSFQGVGNVFIQNEGLKINDEDVREAVENAQTKPLPLEQSVINTFDSYFMLDGGRRVSNPIDHVAHKLEAYIHVIHGDTNRIENFRSLLRDAGFDHEIQPVFSGMASVFGILTDEEKESGILLLDIGAGTTEYVAVFNMGVLDSGVIPIGFEHLANDLSLGLDLHISVCRKLLSDGTLADHITQRKGFVEIKSTSGSTRKIPLNSFERIIDLRLQETFKIINRNIHEKGIFRSLGAGGVLTGGAALFPRTAEIFKEVFQFPVRIGRPYDAKGAVTGLENPRYSTVWGMLKYGELFTRQLNANRKRGVFGSMIDNFDSMAGWLWKGVSDLKNSIKF
ncbi:cell division protein FtsA [Lentisphaerota bacterium ZTH]|nr:cell division protein FtsA [Lentisphaerota bacterium]WET05854.1 cell division protein FtsA [Lentisphaerota bacterium ZTH]